MADGGVSARSPEHVVLIAEDDDGMRESMEIWLDGGWAVRGAANGREALELLDDAVDVLVLDRHMPVVSGPEVVDRLDETGFDGPVIVLTAYEPDEHLDETDVTTYLRKPITRTELLEYLNEHLPGDR